MDLQTYLDNALAARRQETLANSDQLTLGELILKIQAIVDKPRESEEERTVGYDFEYLFPTTIDSWRGSYAELALDFHEHDEKHQPMKVTDFLALLKSAVGKTFTGYKGGDFTMHRQTPIWVANYGNSGHTAIIEVVDTGYSVILITGYREF